MKKFILTLCVLFSMGAASQAIACNCPDKAEVSPGITATESNCHCKHGTLSVSGETKCDCE